MTLLQKNMNFFCNVLFICYLNINGHVGGFYLYKGCKQTIQLKRLKVQIYVQWA